MLPFIAAGLSLLHLALLHNNGSTSPTRTPVIHDYITFYPYFVIKDAVGLFSLLVLFIMFVCFSPNLLGHPDNYIPANPLVTPHHIVPEWYFLPFYAILRSITNKLLGVIAMLAAMCV